MFYKQWDRGPTDILYQFVPGTGFEPWDDLSRDGLYMEEDESPPPGMDQYLGPHSRVVDEVVRGDMGLPDSLEGSIQNVSGRPVLVDTDGNSEVLGGQRCWVWARSEWDPSEKYKWWRGVVSYLHKDRYNHVAIQVELYLNRGVYGSVKIRNLCNIWFNGTPRVIRPLRYCLDEGASELEYDLFDNCVGRGNRSGGWAMVLQPRSYADLSGLPGIRNDVSGCVLYVDVEARSLVLQYDDTYFDEDMYTVPGDTPGARRNLMGGVANMAGGVWGQLGNSIKVGILGAATIATYIYATPSALVDVGINVLDAARVVYTYKTLVAWCGRAVSVILPLLGRAVGGVTAAGRIFFDTLPQFIQAVRGAIFHPITFGLQAPPGQAAPYFPWWLPLGAANNILAFTVGKYAPIDSIRQLEKFMWYIPGNVINLAGYVSVLSAFFYYINPVEFTRSLVSNIYDHGEYVVGLVEPRLFAEGAYRIIYNKQPPPELDARAFTGAFVDTMQNVPKSLVRYGQVSDEKMNQVAKTAAGAGGFALVAIVAYFLLTNK